ncbi:gluconokinase [Neorhizobium sp. NCHU2750]|uniref:gluconokinase n=1 Tax=Neorhizobium sp. NCHU2750 TaxID=1825976 RepID=UPI000E759776|nr:gluconokinase [Neorhizobium sp. NCHU2750]
MSKAIIVMGVSGAGKSSVAELLATRIGSKFVEGDRLHPEANVKKMAEGTPLTDEDRWPWLDIIGRKLKSSREAGEDIVLTCSSLKKIYRDRLRSAGGEPLYFVFLKGTPELLAERMGARKGHFMPTALLQSQLATLESPEGEPGVVTVNIDAEVSDIVADSIAKLETLWASNRE